MEINMAKMEWKNEIIEQVHGKPICWAPKPPKILPINELNFGINVQNSFKFTQK
jgi:hypothetical protein